MFKGIDLNRASVGELKLNMGISDREARVLFTERPFFSVLEAKTRGFISKKSFSENKLEEQIEYFTTFFKHINSKRIHYSNLVRNKK